jgi:hypothetical protein
LSTEEYFAVVIPNDIASPRSFSGRDIVKQSRSSVEVSLRSMPNDRG